MDPELITLFEQHHELQKQIDIKQKDIKALEEGQIAIRRDLNDKLSLRGYGLLLTRYFSGWRQAAGYNR